MFRLTRNTELVIVECTVVLIVRPRDHTTDVCVVFYYYVKKIIIIIYSHTWKLAHTEAISHTYVNWIIRPQVTLIITQK